MENDVASRDLDSSETFLSLTHSLTHSATQERKVKAKNLIVKAKPGDKAHTIFWPAQIDREKAEASFWIDSVEFSSAVFSLAKRYTFHAISLTIVLNLEILILQWQLRLLEFFFVNFGVLVFGNSDAKFVDCFWIFFVRNATSETETTDRRKPFYFQLLWMLVCVCVLLA